MQYLISFPNPDSRFIKFELNIDVANEKSINLQLPTWRPGRYELQHFAKNIRKFEVSNMSNQPVSYKKITKDCWEINCTGINNVVVSYEYFANQPDAGGSYICKEFVYINPVNCMMYVVGKENTPYSIQLDIPNNYKIATQLKQQQPNVLLAPNFDYLADSPLIASANLEHHSFTESYQNSDYTIHMWFQGKHPFDTNRLINDTQKYTTYQVDKMGHMPCKEYHFLYLMHEKPFRHGVEHMDSTVITMGQLENQTTEEFYHDLLAISSHELFHLWNIKRLRPVEMLPYDFTKENYCKLGYIYEGITTYLGDLFLLHSGVWDIEQYLNNLKSDLVRHYKNNGRHNYSLADSSFDTWLDGYVQGVPERKISIYIEGLVAALVVDVLLIERGGCRLYDIMRKLYEDTSLKGKGYTEADYQTILENHTKGSFKQYFDELVHGRGFFDKWRDDVLNKLAIVAKYDPTAQTLALSASSAPTELFKQWIELK
jgi:predicted metalloprotease with PDZ domain